MGLLWLRLRYPKVKRSHPHIHPLPRLRRQIDRIDQFQIRHGFIAICQHYLFFAVEDNAAFQKAAAD
jgi:hypothetical protein